MIDTMVWLQRALIRSIQVVPRDRFFTLNLSSRDRWYIGPARTVAMLLAAGLCVFMIWDVRQAWELRDENDEMTATVARVQAQDHDLLAGLKRRGIDLSDASIQQLPKEVAFANEVIAKKAFSWTRFLSELEQSIPPRIAISSIRIDSAGSVVHLSGSASDLEDIAALTVRFQDHPRFKEPVLGQHRDAGNGLVEFDLSLQYKSSPS